MTDEDSFRSVVPFGIDAGELADLSREYAFMLGAEFALVLTKSRVEQGFSAMCHAENVDRISAMLQGFGHIFMWKWMGNDKSETWVVLTVEVDKEKLF